MTQTAPVMSGLAISGGSGGVAGTGIEGLFAALMGGTSGTVGATGTTDAQDLLASLMQGLGTSDLEGLQALLSQQSLSLDGSADVQLQGDSATLASFMQLVQQVYQKVVISSGVPLNKLNDPDELTAALTKLGMQPEQAQAVAQRIDTMLALLEKQEGVELDDNTEGTLAAMMLATMAQSQSNQGFVMQVVSVEKSEVSIRVARSFTPPVSSVSDMLRDSVSGSAASVDTPQAAAEVVGVGRSEKSKNRELMVQVSSADNTPPAVAVVMPGAQEVVKADTSADTQTKVAAVSAQVGAQQPAPVVTKVAADKVLEKVEGDTVYSWKADVSGNETLQAVQPAGDSNNAATLAQQMLQQDAKQPAVTAPLGDGQSFADKLAAAQKNDVAGQVAVQIKPLAEEGGGTVRMLLNPPELGEVRIELSVTDGKVHGSIAASDNVVVEQLARELHSLRHGLADAGLKLSEQGINLMLSNNGAGYQQNNGQAFAQQNGQASASLFNDVNEDVLAEIEPVANWVAPERVLDVRI